MPWTRSRRGWPGAAIDWPRLVYLDSAVRDLAGILEYLAEQSGSRAFGRAFVNRLTLQCRKLASLPGTQGRPRPDLRPGLRSFAKQGYVIFFRYERGAFEVVNVIEGHRDMESRFRTDSP